MTHARRLATFATIAWAAHSLSAAATAAGSSHRAPIATATHAPTGTLAPATVLARYIAALAKLKEPRALTFDYTLEQTGARYLEQSHRVFRSGADERDETLSNDGKTLPFPDVRIFRGRPDHYRVSVLAPRVARYTFTFVGTLSSGRHDDYTFRLHPRTAGPFAETDVTIDGNRFLPTTISFKTGQNAGSGTVTFAPVEDWWVPTAATANAVVGNSTESERISFMLYRFPPSLPPSTFATGGSSVETPASAGASVLGE